MNRRGARLAIAIGVLLLSLFADLALEALLRVDEERTRFLGQCRKADKEGVPPATLLASAAPVGEAEEVNALPAPERAELGELPVAGPDAELARRYEPILNVGKADRFWPIPVPTVLRFELEKHFTTLVSRTRTLEPVGISDLRPNGGPGQYLDYPAQLDHVEDEFCSQGRALGILTTDLAQWRLDPDLLEPARSAQFYFFDHPVKGGGRDLQYWFFYALNYLPELTDNATFLIDPISSIAANADFHEGDFEHVTVQLRDRGGALVPTAVKMARHKGEDRTIPWDSPELQRSGDHPVVYAGFGGHASYERCGRHNRHALGFIRLTDWALCGETRNFVFGSETPLVDLRGVSWACWPGHFGEVPRSSIIPELLVAGPRSPYFQDDADVRRELCPRH